MEEQSQAEQTPQTAYLGCLYQMEIERLKYVLSSYLRCRLLKLERFFLHWLAHPEGLEGVASERELEFLAAFAKAKKEALYESVLKHLPPPMATLPGEGHEEDLARKPKKNGFVICRVMHDLGPVQVDPS